MTNEQTKEIETREIKQPPVADILEVKRLNENVKRNKNRFPDNFCFQLTEAEMNSLRSQFVTSKGKGGRRYLPYAFTEQGIAMLSANAIIANKGRI